MKILILAAGAAALALSAGSATAAAKHRAMGSAVAPPKQPIPYSQLDNYLKASPKTRASKDWWSEASTGMAADTSATTRAMPGDTPASAPEASGPTGAVNPTPADASATTPPPVPDAAAPNSDQGKGDMTPPATDKPH